MAKKFISFLGAGKYSRCKYVWPESGQNTGYTLYIQEALLRTFAKGGQPGDLALIFVTDKADESHWRDNPTFNEERGLRTILRDLVKEEGFQHLAVEPIWIPDGLSEDQIWEIFRIVYDQIGQGDEIVFDITHAFRTIPMLALALLNFAKFVKGIKVERICYGAYEARDPNTNTAPIVDVTSFSVLQDWTAGASDFIHFGNADRLVKLVKGNRELSRFKRFAEELGKSMDSISTIRGREIYSGQVFKSLEARLAEAKTIETNLPLGQLLEKIEHKISGMSREDLLNGFRAVRFCIDHNLVQQGITLLQESVVTYFIHKLDETWSNEDVRKTISGALSVEEKAFKHWSKKSQELHPKVYAHPLHGLFAKTFRNLTSQRNDINHSGLRPTAQTSGKFAANLERYFLEIKKVVETTENTTI